MVVVLLALPVPCAAQAASPPSGWQPVETLGLVRGTPEPQVAIDERGKAVAAYSTSDAAGDSPRIALAWRPPAGGWRQVPAPSWFGESPDVAVNPNGATAIASVRDGVLSVTVFPAPGPVLGVGAPPARHIGEAGHAVTAPQVAIDAAGSATVTWTSPALLDGVSPYNQVHAVTLTPAGDPGPVQTLGGPGQCRPQLDVNLRGDTVVSGNCFDQSADVFYRPAGGAFDSGVDPFPPDDSFDEPIGVSLDGAGVVHAVQGMFLDGPHGPTYEAWYAVRPPAGPFGPAEQFTPVGSADSALEIEANEDGGAVATWATPTSVRYAVRPPGASFGPVKAIAGAVQGREPDLIAAPRDRWLISWRGEDPGIRPATMAVIGKDGSVTTTRAGVVLSRGASGTSTLSFAISSNGLAVGAWEQRCSPRGAYAVMATVRDNSRSNAEPPCQDLRAPKVVLLHKRAVLSGRDLRVRTACDEACQVVARVRVLAQGQRKPLATAKTREQSLHAARGRWLRLRLSRTEARRVALALAAGRKVNARLAFSVRDRYGNGAVRRPHVPVRR
jgi:hypothetical protein